MKETCVNCKWSKFERTKGGRLVANRAGRCLYEVTLPPLPWALHRLPSMERVFVWPNYPPNGIKCQTWEALNAKG